MNWIKNAAEALKQGKQSSLAILYQGLVYKDNEVVNYAAGEIAEYMKKLDSGQTIRLEEQFREYSSMEWTISWEKVELSEWENIIENRELYFWILRLGTFHPNGYFREKCIRRLAEDRKSVKYIVLRLNDWAGPVREAAEQAVMRWIRKLQAEELVECLPYLEKVKQGMRRDRDKLQVLEQGMADRIQDQLRNVELGKIRWYDLKIRKSLYRLLFTFRILDREEADGILNREKDGPCQAMLITWLFRYYEISMEELDCYLNHKSKVVQKKALEQKYSILKTSWDGLEKLLLSPSAGIRGMAGYILGKHTDFDLLAYYAERLETSRQKICILGIGEYGHAEDAELVVKYLESPEAGIVKSALHTVGRLLGTKADEIFWKYLQDERPVVQRAAFREMMANDIVYGAERVYTLFVQTESALLRELMARQLLKEDSWTRLPYLLQLFCYEEEAVRNIVRRGVYVRNVYGRISEKEAQRIRGILYDERYGIPEHLQKSIEFDLKFVVR
ncbi:MAG: hypothetical protein J6A77_11105 [Lachnospiraceae bacterium]|nr:hypothetical protein [Lachnospiraceae bacterium]